VKPLEGLRTLWQQKTGEEETPFDGDAPVWLISMVFHLVLMIVLAFVPLTPNDDKGYVELTAPVDQEEEELELPDEFYFSDLAASEVGANSEDGVEMAEAVAPEISVDSVVPTEVELEDTDIDMIEIDVVHSVPTGLQYSNLPVKGAVGEGTTGAGGAIDLITHEILLSLEERETLVVWLFDQSASLNRQRREIVDRFDRIYDELGVIEAAGDEAFAKHDEKPLLTSVVAFGKNVNLLTKQPTDNIAEIKKTVSEIPQDDSGDERVFAAISMVADHYKKLRYIGPGSEEPERNVMLVVLTDEAGDDASERVGDKYRLDTTIQLCRRYQMPVYVVGVPAPFGRKETVVKWVDPDPKYDQTPQWGRVDQGPESLLPERVKLHFVGDQDNQQPIDSGFGPFALTRLTYETGGIYFAVHPNRNVNRAVSRRETAAFSAHIEHFFDPHVMRKYRPDYVTVGEYKRRVNSNMARAALLSAASSSWQSPMESPQLRFEKRDEASFVNALTEAQKAAAKLEPKMEDLYQKIKEGEKAREKETVLRWQAGFDLAYGRIMATKVRTQAYNAMLAEAKRGLKFKNEKSNVWVLKPADEISTGSADAKLAKKAKDYLQRVIDEHAGTPWAMLAERELSTPLGWKWEEDYVAPPQPRTGNPGNGNNNNNNNNNNPAMMKRPTKRRVPKL